MKLNYIYILFVALFVTSCSDSDLDPTISTSKEAKITSLEDMNSVLYGMYNRMSAPSYYGRDVIIYGACRSNNAFSNGNSGRFTNISDLKYTDADSYVRNSWTQIYRVIASANLLINADFSDADTDMLNHIKGQALAARALAHYDLVRNWGQQFVENGGESALGVPYITEFKSENLLPARLTVGEVKSKIYADLDQALTMLSDNFNEILLSKHAAYAIQSRVATYFGDSDKVISASEALINTGAFSVVPVEGYAESFASDGAVNSIFEIANSENDNNGINGLANIYRGSSYGDIQAFDEVLSVFAEGDVRASAAMIGLEGEVLRNLGKYPSSNYAGGSHSDYVNNTVLRYEEVLLNYAEALFRKGDAAKALSTINSIVSNRGVAEYTSITLDEILLERRRELIFEGFGFDDLARTGKKVDFVSPLNPGPEVGTYEYAFPIPVVEINANSNMVQNAGY